MPADTLKTSEFWTACLEERQAPGRAAWMYAIDHPRLRAGLYDTYLGGLDPFSWMRARMAAPARHALEIGCGGGDLAFGLIEAGTCERIDAFDIAEGAIAAAQARVGGSGLQTLRFHLLDGNTWAMARNQYDFVYASHALHHIENLEHLFAQVAATLQPGGVLFASDYIGPSRMQYADAHLAAMNAALATLPEAKRLDRFGVLKTAIERRPVELYLQHDPSEAARSAEIIPVMRRFFDVEVVPMGMSLSFEVLLDIAHNFDPDDDGDNALIDGIMRLEQEAERSGQAEPLFACLVARHKAAPPAKPPVPPLDLDAFRGIEGWMADEAADLTSRLFHWQRSMQAVTGVLELGVFKGRYLSLLASLAQGTDAPIVGVDAFTSRVGEQIPGADRDYARDVALATVAALAPGSAVPTLIVAFTADVEIGTLRGLSPGGYSFISVDAGHLAADVKADLAMVGQLTTEHTIIAADDVFNPQTPGVMEGLCRHFAADPRTVLAPFAWAGNKLFLCHWETHATLLAYVRDLLYDPAAPPYIAKSRATHAHNQRLGFAPSLFGYEVFAFEWM
jgi:SAM-dependent methyltransferase